MQVLYMSHSATSSKPPNVYPLKKSAQGWSGYICNCGGLNHWLLQFKKRTLTLEPRRHCDSTYTVIWTYCFQYTFKIRNERKLFFHRQKIKLTARGSTFKESTFNRSMKFTSGIQLKTRGKKTTAKQQDNLKIGKNVSNKFKKCSFN